MKITNVQAICLKYPYERPIADGCTPCYARSAVLVRVETDTQLYGLGEAATFGGNLDAMKVIVERQLAPLLVGEDPLDIERLWNKLVWNNWSAGRRGMVMGGISGIDIALWDLLGKAAGMPLYRLLGANAHRVQGYASAGFYAPGKEAGDLERELEGYCAMGFSDFKMKIGRVRGMISSPLRYMKGGDWAYSYEQDAARIAAARRVIGPGARLMVDMNCTWDPDAVVAGEQMFREYGVYWVEEPTRSDDVRSYARIAASLKSTLVAGIESEQGLARYSELVEMGALDVVQANLGWAGGITEARRIAALALAHGKMFTPHTFFSAVLNAANVHFSASLSNVPFIECELNPSPLRTDLLKQNLEMNEHMCFILPQGPGLGIEVDWEKAKQYIYKS